MKKTPGSLLILILLVLLTARPVRADVRSELAKAAARAVIAKFGAKAAGRSVPALAGRIELLAARHGTQAMTAVRRVGPTTFGLVEAAGVNGGKAVRVMAIHGEKGAFLVVARPTAMKQFLRYGDKAAVALVRHPGLGEKLIGRGGMPAIRALGAIKPQNGRRLAMMLEGQLAKTGKHPELMEVIAKHGDKAASFIWRNKAVLAGGAALTAFLANPEPFINGSERLVTATGNAVVKPAIKGATAVAKPAVQGLFNLLNVALGLVGVLIVAAAILAYKHGLPSAATVKDIATIVRK